jgi:glycosyltransferase involved in cell wall biosynthesis
MLVPHPRIQGPLPKIVPLLVDGMRAEGLHVDTEPWSRRSDHEALLEKLLGRTGDLWRIVSRLRSGRYDVLFVTTAHSWASLSRDIPLMFTTSRSSLRRVLQFHGSCSDRLVNRGGMLFKAASRLLVGMSDVSLVLSRQEQAEWSRFSPHGRFELVANPFIPDAAGLAERSPSLVSATGPAPEDAETLTLLFAGRLMPEKGILDLVRALADLKGLPCRVLVAGDGACASEVARLARELGVADRVILLGYVAGPDLVRCYEGADVFVLPTYWSEGFPTVLLEAMNAGLPIVTTAWRGAIDWLEEGKNALFVPPRRPDLLADALLTIMTDAGLRASMSVNNLAKVREFSPELVVPRYVAIIESLVGSGSEVAT